MDIRGSRQVGDWKTACSHTLTHLHFFALFVSMLRLSIFNGLCLASLALPIEMNGNVDDFYSITNEVLGKYVSERLKTVWKAA